ncbi:MAG: hypothetical protein ACOH2V_00910 [Candidatus Saccharimonadaceae bacterium]
MREKIYNLITKYFLDDEIDYVNLSDEKLIDFFDFQLQEWMDLNVESCDENIVAAYDRGYESGCKSNELCEVSEPSSEEIDDAYQSGYDDRYSTGFTDGEESKADKIDNE